MGGRRRGGRVGQGLGRKGRSAWTKYERLGEKRFQ